MAQTTSAHALSPAQSPACDEPELIQDRYRVERPLGRGGMGEVLLVEDLSTGRKLALKRLLAGAKPRHVMLLQREYHTLVGLSHPHVVQAYDYGNSQGSPFYTMELLAGSDVDGLAPLPWQRVAGIMRELAGALAVIHARGLVHRDVTARNVWMTEDGTIKLLDFGALSSFGEAREMAGTPPFVAPEVLRTGLLDQRTDLYSLGALGYYLLTGRHAYPARALAELEQYWADDFRPAGERVAELGRSDLPSLPAPLEQLIDELLEAEPGARPDSAGDVIDRLSALLPDAQTDKPAAVQGTLASKAFVGRESELKRLRALLKQASSGLGVSAALIAPQGGGRSRLLAEFAAEARLSGATVLSVRADGDRDPLSAASRCALRLLESLPSVARGAAAAMAPVLGHVSSSLREQLGLEEKQLEQFPEASGEARMRMHAALSSWWLEVASSQPLVILLDDLQDMDEPSAALFAALSRELDASRLLVLAAVRRDPALPLSRVTHAFLERASQLQLPPFDEQECSAVLRSMFGDAEHVARAAQRLVEAGEGNPARIVELAAHLVRSEAARYVEGHWVLPQDIATLALPSTRDALDETRLSALGHSAHALALQLSVAEGTFSLEICQGLSRLPAHTLFAALAELLSAGVLIGSEDSYRFRRESLRLALLQQQPLAELQHSYGLLAELLLGAADISLLNRARAGLHLLRSGQRQRGFEVINQVADMLVSLMAQEPVEVAHCMEHALPLLRESYDSDHELMPVLCALAMSGFFVEQRLGALYGDEALERAGRALGVHRARRLRPFLGRKLSLYIALFCAALVFARRRAKNKAIPDFASAMRMLFAAAAGVTAMHAVCISREQALKAAQTIEPMSALGKNHIAGIVYDFSMGFVKTVQDRLGETAGHWRKLLARLDDPRPIEGCDEISRLYYRCGALYALGVTECWRDDSSALAIAEQLEQQPLTLYRLSAEQLRALYYGHQGNSKQAAHHKALVEVRALQRGVTWQVEIWSPSAVIAVASRQHDAMAAKRAAEQLHHVSAEVSSLSSHVQTGRAAHLMLRGRFVEAIAAAKEARRLRDPDLVSATFGLAQLAQAYNEVGKHQRALELCTQALARLSAADLRYTAQMLSCQIELARAEAGLGNHGRAAELLDALLAQHEPARGPLTLGSLHEARGQVARLAGDTELAETHLAAMQRWYRGTGCTTLVQHCERMRKSGRARRARHDDAANGQASSTGASFGNTLTKTDHTEPLARLLSRLVRAGAAADGLLFSLTAGALTCVAHTSDSALSPELTAWVQSRVQAGLLYTTETEDSLDAVDLDQLEHEGTRFRLWLLQGGDQGAEPVVGALVLMEAMLPVGLELLQRTSGRLLAERSQLVSQPRLLETDESVG